MDQQLTGYQRERQAIIDAMKKTKHPLEEVKISSRKIVKRRISNKESFGLHRQKATITYEGQKVTIYTRDDLRYWSLDMSYIL